MIIFIVFTSLGCDEVEELLEQEVDVSISFDGNLEIVSESAVSSPSEPIDIETQSGGYRITSDPDVKELLDGGARITKVKIESVTYGYQNFEGNSEATVLQGNFFITGGSEVESYANVDTGTNIEQADFNNESFLLLGDFSEIEAGLLNGNSIFNRIRYYINRKFE